MLMLMNFVDGIYNNVSRSKNKTPQKKQNMWLTLKKNK